jgi:polysaccharide biosynthesis protein PslG
MLALAVGIAATAQAAPRSFYGVVPQTALERTDYQRMGDAGVGTLRFTLGWAASDPTRAQGDYAWGGSDAIVAEAARNGVTVLPMLYGSPDWAARGLDGRSCGSRCAIFAPRSKQALAAWGRFVGAAVERYGPGGAFWDENPGLRPQPITAWQVWNEQNSKSFYGPKPSTKGYAKLLDAASQAIRTADRRADVVLGGMAELAGSRKAVPGPKYLAKLYRRPGVERDFDGIAVHPYGAKVSAVAEQMDLFDDETRGDPKASIWVTEVGWGSASGGNPLNVGERGQAKRLKQAYRYFERERKRMKIETVTWFSWQDSATSLCDWCAESGLLSAGSKPKPAYRAFKRVAR